jgi:hypothetical protein
MDCGLLHVSTFWTGVIICWKHDNWTFYVNSLHFFQEMEVKFEKRLLILLRPAFLYNGKYFEKMQHLLRSWR